MISMKVGPDGIVSSEGDIGEVPEGGFVDFDLEIINAWTWPLTKVSVTSDSGILFAGIPQMIAPSESAIVKCRFTAPLNVMEPVRPKISVAGNYLIG